MGKAAALLLASLWLALCTLGLAGSVAAADRVALVIGNGAYENATVLPNPGNDADAVAAVLERIGFDVIKGVDLDRLGMEAKLRDYVAATRDAKVALFFYSGHGMQVDGRNFLIPVDAKFEDATALEFETIDADRVFEYMGGNDRIAVAFLDACRDNPLARRFAQSLGNELSRSIGQGLAVPQTDGTGLFIGFSTAPGDVAADGTGNNSPFTTALLRHIETPGLEINQLMTRVKADVRSETRDDQRPWTNSDLSTDVFLVPGNGDSGTSPPPLVAADEQMWRQIEGSQVAAIFEEFIRLFPESGRRSDAQARIAALNPPKVTPPETPPAIGEGTPHLLLQLAGGTVEIALLPDLAPKHVERIVQLAGTGFYDGIVWHRVIEGFMAQSGDPTGTGTGGSDLPDVPAEFNSESFTRGAVGAARTADPDTFNSQFFICFEDCTFLDGQYTVFGRVVSGMGAVDAIQRGEPPANPDQIISAKIEYRQ